MICQRRPATVDLSCSSRESAAIISCGALNHRSELAHASGPGCPGPNLRRLGPKAASPISMGGMIFANLPQRIKYRRRAEEQVFLASGSRLAADGGASWPRNEF